MHPLAHVFLVLWLAWTLYSLVSGALVIREAVNVSFVGCAGDLCCTRYYQCTHESCTTCDSGCSVVAPPYDIVLVMSMFTTSVALFILLISLPHVRLKLLFTNDKLFRPDRTDSIPIFALLLHSLDVVDSMTNLANPTSYAYGTSSWAQAVPMYVCASFWYLSSLVNVPINCYVIYVLYRGVQLRDACYMQSVRRIVAHFPALPGLKEFGNVCGFSTGAENVDSNRVFDDLDPAGQTNSPDG